MSCRPSLPALSLFDTYGLSGFVAERVMEFLPAPAIASLACVNRAQHRAMRSLAPSGLLHGMHRKRKRWLAEQLVNYVHLCKRHADDGLTFSVTITHGEPDKQWVISVTSLGLRRLGTIDLFLSDDGHHEMQVLLDQSVDAQIGHMECMLVPITLTCELAIAWRMDAYVPGVVVGSISIVQTRRERAPGFHIVEGISGSQFLYALVPTVAAAIDVFSSPGWQSRVWPRLAFESAPPSFATFTRFLSDSNSFSRIFDVYEAADAPAGLLL